MNKKYKCIVCLGCLSALCLGATACGKTETMAEQMAKQGYTVEVIYDPGDGMFQGKEGTFVQDYFNPSHYTPDQNGTVCIPLMDPLDERRDPDKTNPIFMGKSGSFFVGWYTNREVVRNEQEKPLDSEGRELEERYNGTFYYVNDKGEEITTLPAYKYSGLWDFETSKVEYNAAEYTETDGRMSMTLYAGWLNNYTFEYYHEDATSGEWVRYASTSFTYGQGTDNDTIWIPRWENQDTQSGKMNHVHGYQTAQGNYNFPAVEMRTFEAAYTDESCSEQSKITDSFRHQGTVNVETCTAVNPVQKIYVKTLEGKRYRVATAQDLCQNGDAEGQYEILNDLDLTGYSWPTAFTTGVFKGRFEAETPVTISNVEVKITKDVSADRNVTEVYGGLFGYIDADAVLKNVAFENVTVTLQTVKCSQTQTARFGTLAGLIHDDADVSGVSIANATLKLYVFYMRSQTDWGLHMIANGDTAGVTCDLTTMTLQCYAEEAKNYFSYYYDPRTLDGEKFVETGEISFTVGNTSTFNNKNPDLEKYYEFRKTEVIDNE